MKSDYSSQSQVQCREYIQVKNGWRWDIAKLLGCSENLATIGHYRPNSALAYKWHDCEEQ